MGFITPQNVPDALRILDGGDVDIVAGCTDLLAMAAPGRGPANQLDITRLSALRGISKTPDGWRIGAVTTWSDVINADLPAAFDGLKAAARAVGSHQIQNAGTIGGNLCNASPAADGVPPLLTLAAGVELQSQTGTRRVPLGDFITGVRRVDRRRDELLVALHIPDLPGRPIGRFLKLGSRRYLVISIAMVATLVSLDRAGRIDMARVAVGSCSAVAQRLGTLEAALIGRTRVQVQDDAGLWARHLGPLAPIDDIRAPAEYRRAAAAELCRRAVLSGFEGAAHG